jgi:hypothetical protein
MVQKNLSFIIVALGKQEGTGTGCKYELGRRNKKKGAVELEWSY